MGIRGERTSLYIRSVTSLLLPIALMISAVHMIYGHAQPGDGFTAGVIISLAIGLQYVVFGFQEIHRRLWWLRPRRLIVAGIIIAILNGTAAIILEGSFLASVSYGDLISLPLPTFGNRDYDIGTSQFCTYKMAGITNGLACHDAICAVIAVGAVD